MVTAITPRKGYKQTDIGEIPEDWEITKLGDIGDSIIGLTYSPKNISTQGKLVHRSSNIQNNKLAYDDNVYVDVEVDEKLILKDGDILICVRNGSRNLIGKSAIIKGRAVGETFGAFMSIFRTKTHPPLIFYVILSDIVQRQIMESLGATINQITNKTLNNFRIPLSTNKHERELIGAALSDVDALIDSLDALIAKKKDVKQGVMQELLTGKRRLPGFSGEWKMKKLGAIAEITMGQSPQSVFYNKERKGLPLVQGNADIENRKTIERIFTSFAPKKAKKDDVIMTVRAPVGEIAIAQFDCCLGRGVCAISYKNDFLYHSLVYHESSWAAHSKGSTFDSINSKEVSEFKIYMPVDEHEQVKIAQAISDIDKEIECLETKHNKTISLKQGMMQQLLTGNIRLI